jgi:hypothetical protein
MASGRYRLLAAASPRLVGNAAYGAGAAVRGATALGRKIPMTIPALPQLGFSPPLARSLRSFCFRARASLSGVNSRLNALPHRDHNGPPAATQIMRNVSKVILHLISHPRSLAKCQPLRAV